MLIDLILLKAVKTPDNIVSVTVKTLNCTPTANLSLLPEFALNAPISSIL